MIYQRHIPREELFAAQLELLMQNGRISTIVAHLIGVAGTVMLFWSFVDLAYILLWASAFIIILLVSSLHMSNALVERHYREHPRALFWQLIAGAAVTGALWAGVYIVLAGQVPVTMQYVFLLLIVTVTAFSLAITVMVREYFLAYLFTSLFPIAWWNLVHYWDQPYYLLIGLVLLGFCALLMVLCDRVYRSFRNMIALNWEREAMSQELGDLANSLRDRNRQLQDARRQLTDLANVDELTGLGNRRLVNKTLQEEINRARRGGTELSVILLDVDFFKDYNDNYGHPAGDVVLQRLSDLMQRATSRAGEVVARYGGEEFIIVLPGASAKSALRTATRLKELVEVEAIPHEFSSVADHITVSQGVYTAMPEGEMVPSDLIKPADQALYRAKDTGRNTITVA